MRVILLWKETKTFFGLSIILNIITKIIDECSSTLFVKILHEKHSRKMSSRKTFTSYSSRLIPLEFQHNSGIHQGLDDVDLCPAATSNRVQLLALVHTLWSLLSVLFYKIPWSAIFSKVFALKLRRINPLLYNINVFWCSFFLNVSYSSTILEKLDCTVLFMFCLY